LASNAKRFQTINPRKDALPGCWQLALLLSSRWGNMSSSIPADSPLGCILCNVAWWTYNKLSGQEVWTSEDMITWSFLSSKWSGIPYIQAFRFLSQDPDL
jgi:hypothetical protein